MPQSFDVIIVGGGHNGLVTAAYLAKSGRKVVVLEKRSLLGGCSVTEEVWPGYRVSTAAYLTSLLQEKVIRDLDLPRHGYSVYPKDPSFFSAFPDNRYLIFWQNRTKTLSEIGKFSPRDSGRFDAYEKHLERLAQVVESLLLTEPPEFPPNRLGDFVEWLRIMGRLRGLSRDEIVGLVRVFTQSASDFLDSWFESKQVKVTLATDGVIGANGGPRSPGTAYILLHHCMGGVNGQRGLWGFVRGGMGSVSEAIASAAREAGAIVRTDAGVDRVLTKNGKVSGVVLSRTGEEIEAPVIASNLDPKQTFLRLVSPTDLPEDFLSKIRAIRCEGTSLKINFALSGLPDFRALPGPGPHHGATMHICPSVEYVERAWDDAKYGKASARPLIELTLPTYYDDSIAPAGRHIMGAFLQYAPYRLAQGSWDELREPYADHVVDLIEEYVPNIRSIILERQVLTPVDLERRFGITGGNIFHGEMSLDQMFVMRPVAGWARYRTPLKNLYLCGSGAHPGGGVMGAPGYNCAQAILKDTRL